MRVGSYSVARAGNLRTLGDYSNRRRLLGNRIDDDDNDLDHNDHNADVDLDDDRLDEFEPVFGFVRLDVVGLVAILVDHDERLFGGDLDDDNLDDDNDHNHNDDLDDDGRPLRPFDNDLDHNDLDDVLDLDDLDLDDDAGPVFLRVSDVLRIERRGLYDDGLRSRLAGSTDLVVYLDDDLDLNLDV